MSNKSNNSSISRNVAEAALRAAATYLTTKVLEIMFSSKKKRN